jgi:hypothetical protein
MHHVLLIQKLDYNTYDKHFLSLESYFEEGVDEAHATPKIPKKVEVRISDTFDRYATVTKRENVKAPLALTTGVLVTTIEYKDISYRIFLRMMQNTFTQIIEGKHDTAADADLIAVLETEPVIVSDKKTVQIGAIPISQEGQEYFAYTIHYFTPQNMKAPVFTASAKTTSFKKFGECFASMRDQTINGFSNIEK